METYEVIRTRRIKVGWMDLRGTKGVLQNGETLSKFKCYIEHLLSSQRHLCSSILRFES